jgi:hypothetical protein
MADLENRGVDVPALARYLVGFNISIVMVDVLHCVDLGISAHILGNIFAACLDLQIWGTNKQANIDGLDKAIKKWYSETKATNKMNGKLTADRIQTSKMWPKLKVKGAAARGIIGFALKLATEHFDSNCVLVMRLLARFVELLDSEGMLLSESARMELPQLGMRLCETFTKLARQAIGEGRKVWKPSPKLHMFQHLCEWQGLIFNPRFSWCYSDEDLVGQLIDVAESCHSKTLASTAMFKWLTLVYDEIVPQ